MPTTATASPLRGLFHRLKRVGYDDVFLRHAVLPDWWDDSLAHNPASLAQMQLRIAQRLSLPLGDLVDVSKALSLPDVSAIRLKRAKRGTEREDLAPGMVAARNAVRMVMPHLQNLSPLPANLTAVALRKWVLERNPTVDLGGLLDACWSHGIAVFHYGPLPAAAKKFAGMASYEGDRPVVVLASGHDEPARLAFHLAHEVSHVIRGHVKPGGAILCEASFEGATEDKDEEVADGDALELLTGQRDPKIAPRPGMDGSKLAAAALSQQKRSSIHAGTLALIYGKTANRMGVAVNALKLMNMNTGGREIIAGALARRLPRQDAVELPGSVAELLPLFGINCLA
ncbi:MAG: hypothetical protein J0M24_16640 [Verrucomicrobia bacterium]|nr:hypothetical protein [Verrucomicrobiota bacterium]